MLQYCVDHRSVGGRSAGQLAKRRERDGGEKEEEERTGESSKESEKGRAT
jgi:hypothetical protein